MRPRSIAAKLVLATSIVVAVAVVASAWFAHHTIATLMTNQIAARRDAGERAIIRESNLVAKAAGNAAALPLGTNAYSDLPAVLDAALRDDRERGEHRISWIVVTDIDGNVAAQTAGAPDANKRVEFARLLPLPMGKDVSDDVSHVRIAAEKADWVYGTVVLLGDEPVGTLRIGISSEGLERELTASITAARDNATASQRRLLWLAGLILLVGILAAGTWGRNLGRPIEALTLQAKRIAGGDLTQRAVANRRDELGTLAQSFNFMADRIGDLLEEQALRVALAKEMDLARQVQRAMLPPETLDTHGVLRIAGHCEPASSCGGDWWSFRKLGGERLLVVIGDATGHGIHSAMIAATARGAVEGLSSVDEKLLTPEQALRAIDAAIRDVGEHDVIMTAFAAVIDPTAGTLTYANAGQNFPYVLNTTEHGEVRKANVIIAPSNPLGDPGIPVSIASGTVTVFAGDMLACFSDGVIERGNAAGRMYGERRLQKSLIGQTVGDGAALVELRNHVMRDIESFAAGVPAEDDITFVLCHVAP